MRPALPSDHANFATLLSPSGERRYYLGRRNRRFEFSSEASFRFEDLLHASKSTNMGQPALLPLRGRRTKDFFARKNPRLRSGLNPRTWV